MSAQADWIRALRWTAVVVVMALVGLLVMFLGVIGIRPGDDSQGASHIELLMAARAPVSYRIFTTLDAMGWLLIGAELFVLAALSWSAAPIRSALAGAMGMTQLVGSLGGFLRMVGVGDLARSWTAPGSDHAQILVAYDSLERIVQSNFLAGDVLQGIGFLAAGSAALAAARLPRWLCYYVLVPGITASILAWSQIVGFGFLFPVLLVHIGLVVVGLNVAIVIVLSRRSSPQRAMQVARPSP